MSSRSITRIYPLLLACLCAAFTAAAANVNLADGARVAASSTMKNSKAAFVADGVVSDESR
jgi:hypothetical protein